MRDPKRIDGYCDRMKAIWGKTPDWRFGQLMMNLMGEYYSNRMTDTFYVEDEEFFTWMEEKMGVTNDT